MSKVFGLARRLRSLVFGPPLHPLSAHPLGVHVRWPIAVLKSYGRICVRRRDAEDAKKTFIEILKEYHTPMSYAKIIEQLDPSPPKLPVKKRACDSSMWMAIPGHPIVAKARLPVLIKRHYDISKCKSYAFWSDASS